LHYKSHSFVVFLQYITECRYDVKKQALSLSFAANKTDYRAIRCQPDSFFLSHMPMGLFFCAIFQNLVMTHPRFESKVTHCRSVKAMLPTDVVPAAQARFACGILLPYFSFVLF
jgi:hypothetical protein